jgi:hypothetical protein
VPDPLDHVAADTRVLWLAFDRDHAVLDLTVNRVGSVSTVPTMTFSMMSRWLSASGRPFLGASLMSQFHRAATRPPTVQ